jgi:hypothetical protein
MSALAAQAGRGGHPRDDLDGDAVAQKVERFLAAAAEDEGISALEPDDHPVRRGEAPEKFVDLLLAHGVAPGRLADVDPPRPRLDEAQNPLADQSVVDHDVGELEEPCRLQGQKLRVAGPGSDQMNRRWLHRSPPTAARAAGPGGKPPPGPPRSVDVLAGVQHVELARGCHDDRVLDDFLELPRLVVDDDDRALLVLGVPDREPDLAAVLVVLALNDRRMPCAIPDHWPTGTTS